MNHTLQLALALLLVSCARPPIVPAPTPLATQTPAVLVVPPTKVLATRTADISTRPAHPTITSTAEAACNPSSSGYCITSGHFVLLRPIRPPANDEIDLVYGYGSTAAQTRDPHHGVEFSNPTGTPVHAAGEGTVLFAGPDTQATYAPWSNFYGNLIVIQHRADVVTLYAHLSQVGVQAGQHVLAGDLIGEVGATGAAIGSHLHFEVRSGEPQDYFATQNPELWLVPRTDAEGRPLGSMAISIAGPDGQLIRRADFTVGYYPDPAQSPIKIYYGNTYSPELLNSEENAALSGLLPGSYRIAVDADGRIMDRWVEVQSGRLTRVLFVFP